MPDPCVAATVPALTAWLDSAVNHELRGDFAAIKLERIRAFLRLIPSPPAPCTVAGTKGKGSTLRLIEAALIAGGAATVAFTSPHVVSLLERWRIDGEDAPIAVVAAAANSVAALERQHALALTWFERTFAIACLLAADRPGARFLVEVGLGGRLDCANALDAAVTVLTHLSHDHREVLGPTLTHIAREKLAIARAGRPLVVAPQSAAGDAAIVTALAERGASDQPQIQRVVRPADHLPLALPGAHQQDNAATALLAARILDPGLSVEAAIRGMANVALPARCQLMTWRGRRLLIDGAHNGPSLAATLAVARECLRPGWGLVLGLAKDKELDEILAVIPADLPVLRCWYESPRARTAADWSGQATSWPWAERIATVLGASTTDLCISGSFYLAGETLAVVSP